MQERTLVRRTARLVRPAAIRYSQQLRQQQYEGGEGGGDGGDGGNEGGNDGGNENDPPEKKAGESNDDWKARSRTWEKRAQDNKAELDDLKSKNQGQLDKIAEALGLKKAEATPEQLQKALADRDTKLAEVEKGKNASDLKLAIYLEAAKHDGLKGSDLIDSISFMDEAGKLDPQDAKYADKLADLVKKKAPEAPKGTNGMGQPVGGGGSNGGGGANGNDGDDPRKLAARIGGRY